MNLNSCIIILLIFSTFFSNAQSVRVINASTGLPVEHVAVYNESMRISTLSKNNGEVDLSGFSKEDSIIFQHPTFYQVKFARLDLTGNKTIYLKKKVILMEEFVISASKSYENKKEIPYMIDVIENKRLENSTFQNSADILLQTGDILVQKSQSGGGSPNIRGFEANKILLVVDGVRLNNAIYRSGHLQNSITIDNSILERVEIIYGPSSLIYGSDALGGVIHYLTKDPKLTDTLKSIIRVNAKSQYSTANTGKVGHLNINYGTKKFGSLSSITYNNFGDLKMGSNRSPSYGDIGKVYEYVDRKNEMDIITQNNNPDIQKRTAYTQYDFLQKFLFSPDNTLSFTANFQYSTSSKINRFEKFNDLNNNNELKYADWYYGPQNRLLASLKTEYKKHNKLFTNFTSILAYQRIDEDRIKRKLHDVNEIHNEEDVYIINYNLDFFKYTSTINRINYGFEYQYNKVKSNGYNKNIITSITEYIQSRYPDDFNNFYSYAAYINYKHFLYDNFIISVGGRYNYSIYHSKFSDQYLNIIPLPFKEVSIRNGAITGSASLMYNVTGDLSVNLIASTGYRNPNLDDFGKIREQDGYVMIPNNNIEPEYSYNGELRITKTIEGYIRLSGSLFYTLITNAIVRDKYNLGNFDSIYYDGDYYPIAANVNSNKAEIKGLSIELNSEINKNLNFKSNINYIVGDDLSSSNPLGHIPPLFGRTSILYELKKFDINGYLEYNGWKRIEDCSIYGEDRREEATADGFPAWITLNYSMNYYLNKQFTFQFAVNNLLDTYYKVFASGISAPGRNFIFTIKAAI